MLLKPSFTLQRSLKKMKAVRSLILTLLQSGKDIFRSLKCVITPTLPTFYPFPPLFELIISLTRHTLLAFIYFQNSNDGGKSTKCGKKSEELPFLSSIDIICGLYQLFLHCQDVIFKGLKHIVVT